MTEHMRVGDNPPIKVNTFYRVSVTNFEVQGPIETRYFRTYEERDGWLGEHDVPPLMSNRDGSVVYADLGEYNVYDEPLWLPADRTLLVSYSWGIAMLTEESQRWFGLTPVAVAPVDLNRQSTGETASTYESPIDENDGTLTVFVGIGNSDGKLNARQWHEFVSKTRAEIEYHRTQLIGEWHSVPGKPWLNAQFAFTISPSAAATLKTRLRKVRELFGQDATAWAETLRTEFV